MPLALMKPSVAFPPSIGRPPTGPTDQVTVVTVPPVSEPVKEMLLAGPDVTGRTQFAGGGAAGTALVEAFVQFVEPDVPEMLTVGAGVIVTVELAESF